MGLMEWRRPFKQEDVAFLKVSEALRCVEEGHARGKVVITV
jgi:hypothetical protein